MDLVSLGRSPDPWMGPRTSRLACDSIYNLPPLERVLTVLDGREINLPAIIDYTGMSQSRVEHILRSLVELNRVERYKLNQHKNAPVYYRRVSISATV